MYQPTKRLTSLLLAIVMVFSLMGTAVAADSTEPTDTTASTETIEPSDSTAPADTLEPPEAVQTSTTTEATEVSETINPADVTEKSTETTESTDVTDEPTNLTTEEDPLPTGVWSDQEPILSDEIEDSLRPIRKSPSQQVRDTTIPTFQQAYDAMVALKSTYPEGMTWTNYEPYGSKGDRGPYYQFRGGKVYGGSLGVGCAAFAFLLSDAAFGDIPAQTYYNGEFTFKDVKVGDILRVNNNSHFVIVLQKSAGGVIVAEGNYNKSVHWGRAMSAADVEASTFVVSRYAKNYVDPSESSDDEEIDNGTAGELTWTLTKYGVLTISGNAAMPDYDPNDNNLPEWSQHTESINTIIIEDGVKTIGDYAFYHGKEHSVSIPSSVTSIGVSAFEGQTASTGWCSNLVAVTLPESVKTISNNAFRNCASLTSVSISEGLQTIGDSAFHSCTSLKYIDFPASITSIGAGAFTSCLAMTQVRFAPGTKSVTIGNNLFTQCQRLTNVVLPANADRISNGMFQSCTSLTKIAIPKGVSHIMDPYADAINGPFSACPYLQVIDFEGTEEEWKTKNGPEAIKNTNGGGTITVNYEVPFNNPFVTDPNDPGDRITDPDSHTQANCPNKASLSPDQHCEICGAAGTKTETETPPTPPTPSTHDHSWSQDWSNDATHHWHECGTANCPATANSQKEGYGEHSYGGWITDTAATASQNGSRHRDCTVCGKRQTPN